MYFAPSKCVTLRLQQVKCDDHQLDRQVESQIQNLLLSPEHPTSQTLAIAFLERERERRGWFLFGSSAEIEWERWYIKMSIREVESEEEHGRFERIVQKNLLGCLLYIATMASEQRTHIPPVSQPIQAFPFRIFIPNGNNGESWGSIIRKMIADSSAPGLLS